MIAIAPPITRPAPSLTTGLCCPWCQRKFFASWLVAGYATHECQRCERRWWAWVVPPGNLIDHFANEFQDREAAERFVFAHGFPESIPSPHYLQLPMTGNDFHNHARSGPIVVIRALLGIR
jgi:hypothetical protein